MMTIELGIAVGAFVVSVFGVLLNYYKLKDAQKTWRHEQKIQMEKDLLFKKMEKRFSLYQKTFSLLGSVRDIEYPKAHHADLESNKRQVIKTADLLLQELYGEAGLVMEYETRSLILKTYQLSYKYAENQASLAELIDSYYLARRHLRMDLSFDDSGVTKSSEDILKDAQTELLENELRDEESMWASKGELAHASRPGYPNKNVPISVLNETISFWKKEGIKSVVCLLSDSEIKMYYTSIKGDLISFYQEKGFEVFHMSIEDYLNPPVSESELAAINTAYQHLPKPVLVHCGAGKDRTGCLVEYLIKG